MRKPLTCFILALMCACSTITERPKNQENQEFTHPACVVSEQFAQALQGLLDHDAPGGRVILNYCGPLAPPDEMLGIALFEATVPLPEGGVNHSFFILKFANDEGKWVLLAEPESIVDFVHQDPGLPPPVENSSIRL